MSFTSLKNRPIIYRPMEQSRENKYNNKKSKIQVSLHQPTITRTIKLNNQVSRERQKSQLNKNHTYIPSQNKIKSQAGIMESQSKISVGNFPKYIQKQIEKPVIYITTIKNEVKQPFLQLQAKDKVKTNSFYEFLTKIKPEVQKPKSSYKFYTNCTMPTTVVNEFPRKIQHKKLTRTQPIEVIQRKISIDVKKEQIPNLWNYEDKIVLKTQIQIPLRTKFISVTDRNTNSEIPKTNYTKQGHKVNDQSKKQSFSKKWEDKLNAFARSKQEWMTKQKNSEEHNSNIKPTLNTRVQRFNSHYNRYEQIANKPNISGKFIPSNTLRILPINNNHQEPKSLEPQHRFSCEVNKTNYFINTIAHEQKNNEDKQKQESNFERRISLNNRVLDDYLSDKSIADSKPTQAKANQSPQRDFFPETDLKDSIYLQSPVKPYQKLLYELVNEKQNLSLGTFQEQTIKGQYLGMGRFSSAYLCFLKCTNFLFVLKEIYKFTIKLNNLENQLLREIQIQAQMNHPNIISLYYAYSSQSKYYIALEYGQMTLLKLLEQQKVIPQQTCIEYLRQIIEGLEYLHSQQIIHRDIKPENIIMVNNVCKIADFGWSVKNNDMTGSVCGTPGYASPQIMNLNQYSYKTDCWSLGMLAYEIAYGKLQIPQHSQFSHGQLMKKVQQRSSISPNYKDFIRRLLTIQQFERMEIKQAKFHKLFSKQQTTFQFE